jgi:hypothetical protein
MSDDLEKLDRLCAEKGLKPIPNHWPPYAADKKGNIWNVANKWRSKAPRILCAIADQYGYPTVRILIDGNYTAKKVHALVCAAFHGPRPDGCNETRHLNGKPYDNRPQNLRWGTTKENYLDRVKHGRDGLKRGNVRAARQGG